MVRSVTFTNRFGRSLRCILGAPGSTCIAISKITGLGPGPATVNIHDIATADGGYVGSSRFSSRNIVVTFSFLSFDEDGRYVPVETTRHIAYSFFQPKTKLQLVIESDERLLSIEGVIENFDPDLFLKDESAQLSILCPGYYYKNADLNTRTEENLLYSRGLFEFPFSNEIPIIDTEDPHQFDYVKHIKFGDAAAIQEASVYYNGDAETGIKIEFIFNGEVVNGDITLAATPIGDSELGNVGYLPGEDAPEYLNWREEELVEQYIKISMSELASRLASRYAGNLYADGNRIIISSVSGAKSAKFILADDTEYNIMGYIEHLEWLDIYPGTNTFVVKVNNNSTGHLQVSIFYDTLYSGV